MAEFTLQNYYIDPGKSGSILTFFMNERHMNYSQLHVLTGIQYDTLRKYMSGQNQRVTLDCLLKILAVTEHTLEDYFSALFAVDGVHFYDSVVFHNKSDGSDKPSESPAKLPDTPPTIAELEHYTQCLSDAHEREMQRTVELYENQLRQLSDIRRTEMDMLEQRYTASVSHLQQDLQDLKRQLLQKEAEIEGLNRLLSHSAIPYRPNKRRDRAAHTHR